MKSSVLVLLLLALAGVALQAQEKVPLVLELPKPLFVGTPVPVKVSNLENPTASRRAPLLVPPGTVNLAKDRPVTASDSFPVIGEVSFVTDGDKTGTDGSFVEFGPGVQWTQIDLGESCTLWAIAVWHFHSQARVYHDVVVQVSDDPEFARGVQTLYNNDEDNSAGLGAGKDPAYVETNAGRLIEARGVKARYVRLYSNANTTDEMNHYVEVEVHGQK